MHRQHIPGAMGAPPDVPCPPRWTRGPGPHFLCEPPHARLQRLKDEAKPPGAAAGGVDELATLRDEVAAWVTRHEAVHVALRAQHATYEAALRDHVRELRQHRAELAELRAALER